MILLFILLVWDRKLAAIIHGCLHNKNVLIFSHFHFNSGSLETGRNTEGVGSFALFHLELFWFQFLSPNPNEWWLMARKEDQSWAKTFMQISTMYFFFMRQCPMHMRTCKINKQINQVKTETWKSPSKCVLVRLWPQRSRIVAMRPFMWLHLRMAGHTGLQSCCWWKPNWQHLLGSQRQDWKNQFGPKYESKNRHTLTSSQLSL